MTAYHSGGNRDYSRFDKMSTEQLEEILRTDAQLPDGNETDEDFIFYVMGVLAERNKQDANKTYKTAEEACEIFQKDYLNCSQSSEPLHIDFKANKLHIG